MLGDFWRRGSESELDEELAYHLEREAEKLMRAGLPAEEARRRARLAFGGATQIKEEVRTEWGWRRCQDLLHDARYALRVLRKSPVFTSVAVLSLALGIGANTAIFSIIDAVLLKSLPVREPGRLGSLQLSKDNGFTYALWQEIRERQDVFSGMLAYSPATFDLASGGEKNPAQGSFVSGDYFQTLGVTAAAGRLLMPEDDQRSGGPSGYVAVISYSFWQRVYGGDPGIAGRTIRLDGHPFQIVGVTARHFFGVNVGTTFDVMVPLTSEALFHPEHPNMDYRAVWWLSIMGRLKPGVDTPQAALRLHTLSPSIFQAALPGDMAPEFQRLFLANILDVKTASGGLSDLRDQYGQSLLVLMGIVGLVLLIACINIANLLLARATTRQQEMAVRVAIGAGRGRLVQQLLTESFILSLAGAAGGVLLAQWGSPAIVGLIAAPGETRFLDLSPDLRLLAFAASATILTGMLFGLAPALRTSAMATYEALKKGGRGHSGRGGKWNLGRLLVAAQIAVSLVLLIAAGLLAGSLRNLLHQDMGFRREGVLLVNPDFRGGKYSVQSQSLVADAPLTQFRGIPGVVSAATSVETPIDGGSTQWDVQLAPADGARKQVHAYINVVSPDYFRTLETPVLRGRDFSSADTTGSPHVAILNETAARAWFPGVDPIGRTFYDGTHGKIRSEYVVEVVGLVKDAKYRTLRQTIPATVYYPLSQNPTPYPYEGSYELRVAGAPSRVVNVVKAAVHASDPRISLEFLWLSTQVDSSVLQERLVATLATGFGILALLLTSAGLFGVVASSAARRRSEIAVRIALGATRRGVLWLVLRDLAGVLAIGLLIGLAGALTGARLLRSMLFGLAPHDPATLAVACGVLVGVAAVAGFLPARRAASLDPVVSLREE